MIATYVLSTDTGKVRLAIGDTNVSDEGAGVKPDGRNFADDELTFFIEQAGSWNAAVPMTLRALAAMFSSQATRTGLEQYSEDFTKTVDNLLKTAQVWEERNATSQAPQSNGFSSYTDAPTMFGTKQWGAQVEDMTTE